MDYVQQVPVKPSGCHFIHRKLESLVKERPKSDVILEYDHFLVAIRQNLCTHYNDITVYDSVYLTCSKKLTGSQLSPPHGVQ